MSAYLFALGLACILLAARIRRGLDRG